MQEEQGQAARTRPKAGWGQIGRGSRTKQWISRDQEGLEALGAVQRRHLHRWTGRPWEDSGRWWEEGLPPSGSNCLLGTRRRGHQLVPSPVSPPKQESALKTLGTDGLFLFSSLDTDGDMYISPEEFKPIAEKLTGTRRGWRLGRRAPWPRCLH